MKKVSSALKNYLVDAIVLIAVGLILLLWPNGTLNTIFRLIGIGLLVLGAIKVLSFFLKKDKKDRSVISLLVGVVQIVLGIFFLSRPDVLVAFFPTVAAILLAYGAVVMIVRALKQRKNNKRSAMLALVFGIITLVLAVVILAHPVFLANVLVQAAGISMIVEGVFLLIALFTA